MARDGRIWWGDDGNNVPAIKRFLSEVKQGRVPQTLWFYDEVGHTCSHERKDSKRHLVFAPAKYMSNRQLLEYGVEYAVLPFALYREGM